METKSSIVTIESIQATKLQNRRDLHVYLPPSYSSEPERRYPVMYMHDGQNLFRPSPLSGVAWDVQKTADKLISEGKLQEIIIVGIDNTEDRLSEYIHHAGTGKYAEHKSKGGLYEDFLIHEVKPYIDTHYRTRSEREHTAILGASLGGLVSFYIGFHHSAVFSKIGMMSPSFWWADRSVLRELQQGEFSEKHPFQMWIDVGDTETSEVPNFVVEDANHVVESLQALGYRLGEEVVFHVDPGAKHTEAAWRDRFHFPLLYFFGNHQES